MVVPLEGYGSGGVERLDLRTPTLHTGHEVPIRVLAIRTAQTSSRTMSNLSTCVQFRLRWLVDADQVRIHAKNLEWSLPDAEFEKKKSENWWGGPSRRAQPTASLSL